MIPKINPLYGDVLKHYGAVALPCRVQDPDRKGKVESGVGHAQKTPLKGQRFESLEQAQAYLDHWEERWASAVSIGLAEDSSGWWARCSQRAEIGGFPKQLDPTVLGDCGG